MFVEGGPFPVSAKLLCSLSTRPIILPSFIHQSNPNPRPNCFPRASSYYLLGDTNHAASGTTARVARSLALLVSALAQVVRAGVHDNGPAQHALGPDQLDLLVRDGALGVALAVRLEVAEVADVAFAVGGGAVGLGEGVDWVVERERVVSAGVRAPVYEPRDECERKGGGKDELQ